MDEALENEIKAYMVKNGIEIDKRGIEYVLNQFTSKDSHNSPLQAQDLIEIANRFSANEKAYYRESGDDNLLYLKKQKY